ncbi:MAG: acyl-CoA dehydrogenase family protein [Deltaproteobacteria bacterium]|nr:acyl-CoA dehydrogenase family protein [Deltaproteobacteria bacterium]
MEFALSDELVILRDAVRKFAEKEIAPFADKWDEDHHWPQNVIRKMGEMGLFGAIIPEQYGGTGMGWLAFVIATEEIARASSSLRVAFNMQTAGPGMAILLHGTEEQKQKYLPGLCSGELIGCFAITEPDAASDVMAIKTTARKDGDSYVLNGSKIWISNAQFADLALVYAYTDKEAKAKGMSAFIVELKNNPGIKCPALDKMGTRSSPTGEIVFEDARIPASALLDKEGRGVAYVFECLNRTRISCAAGGVGVAQACLDAVTKYCTERKQFGQEIGQFQMNQELIAQMTVEVEAARLLVYKAAWQKDQGQLGNTLETSMAKYFAGETAQKASHIALKIYGSYGYSPEYPVARYYRDAVLYQIVEGTANIQKMIIAMDQLGYRKANK